MIQRTAPLLAAVVLAACSSGGGDDPGEPNVRPDFLKGAIVSTTYDGVADDLLTAGLGRSGLAGAAPAVANATSPTVAELRRLAIYNNYRALVDITANGGYGTFYGPNVDAFGTPTASEGRIAGEEHLVFADDGSGRENVTMMVQIPATFSLDNPCIVTAASSGSRGVYGAIGTAGEWGLKRGCAVAYTDKGTGNGGHDLAADAVYVMRGTRTTPASAAGTNSIFTANLTPAERAAFNSAFPNRWAYKHAHSQLNPEKDWGRDTLRAIEFAFYMLHQKYGRRSGNDVFKEGRLAPARVIVIASSVSNGGGAAIAAAELDTAGLIDGVAVSEPQIFMNPPANLTIRRGSATVTGFGKTLYDYFTLANLYQPCASLSAAATGSPLGVGVLINASTAANRCTALAARGLVTGGTTAEQANDAMARLLANSWDADTVLLHASHYGINATLGTAITYANAYARASVRDNLCGYSFGGTPAGGVPAQISAAAAAQLFGTANGVPPTSGINLINNNSVGGAALDAASISPSTGAADFNIDGAVCLRELLNNSTLRASIDAAKRTGNLRGKPAIIVHGRADTLVPVNHTSRPYFALNKTVEGEASRLVYYEVKNAQHFDTLLPLAGFDTRFVPLHRYFIHAMDIMYAHLRNGIAIPPSQVVRTVPRGGTPGAAPALNLSNVPAVALTPASADAITFSGNTLTIPE